MISSEVHTKKNYSTTFLLMLVMSFIVFLNYSLDSFDYIEIFFIPFAYLLSRVLLTKQIKKAYGQITKEKNQAIFSIALWAFRFWMMLLHVGLLSIASFNFDHGLQLAGIAAGFGFFFSMFSVFAWDMEPNALLGMNLPWKPYSQEEWIAVNGVTAKTMLSSSIVLFILFPLIPLLEGQYFTTTLVMIIILVFLPVILGSTYSLYYRSQNKPKL